MYAAAASLQSCPTLCDPIDGSPPGSPIPGILQARTLEWVAISFSNAWKVESESEAAQSCPTLNDPMDFSLPGSSVHGIFQARVLEWGRMYRRIEILWEPGDEGNNFNRDIKVKVDWNEIKRNLCFNFWSISIFTKNLEKSFFFFPILWNEQKWEMTVNIGRRRKFMTVPFPSVESKVAARSYKGSMNGKKKKKPHIGGQSSLKWA